MEESIVPVAPVTVLGIGNIILRDEGFGVRAMEYLEQHWEFSEDEVLSCCTSSRGRSIC